MYRCGICLAFLLVVVAGLALASADGAATRSFAAGE